jgi:YidC/Oxa1 family membrane protein insertase
MWDWIINALADCISFFEGFIGDWGLAIILFTVIIRLLLLPLTLKQQKSMAEMQHVQPILAELQAKYADDPQRLNEEMMKFYFEHKFNPLAGCLPMLLQMPIFFALFSVLRYHVPEDASFYNILPSLPLSASTVFSEQGFVASIPYIIFVLLFGILTFLPMILQNNQQQNSMTKIMTVVMTIMMLFVGWTSPAGVVLFWVTSSAWAVIQQQLILGKRNREYQKEEEAEEIVKPVQVDVVRREKKPRPKKKH